MKKLNISIALLSAMLISIYFLSCKKDFTEQDAMNLQNNLTKNQTLFNDSVTMSGLRITYSINIVDASLSTLKSTKSVEAISGAVISLSQNSKVKTIKVDSTGIAVFDSLKMGIATVNITLTGYSTVNYVVNFAKGSFPNGITGGQQLSNIIPMIPIAGSSLGTIQGQVTCESDLTNLFPDPVPIGTKIIAIPSTTSSAITLSGNNSTLITNISYDNLNLSTTTDANGNYSLSAPATLNGLTYSIIVSDFITNQALLVNQYNYIDTTGVVYIPTEFGSDITTALVTSIPSVPAAYATISAPNYTYTQATATAVLGNSNGINNIQLTNAGAFYTPSETFNLPIDTPYFTGTATPTPGSATFTVNSYGQVSGITMSSNGSNYPAVGTSSIDNLPITIPYFLQKATFTVDTGNNNGGITSTTVALAGIYFINNSSQITIINVSGNGSGAILTPNFTYSNTNKCYTVSSITINNAGSGYAHNQEFIVSVSTALNNPASGIIHLQSGVVSTIQVSNQGTNYISGNVNVAIDPPQNGGTQATATATVTNGKITAISITSGGSGYTSVPNVNIISTITKVQAKIASKDITIDKYGDITAIALTNGNAGSGYLSVPTVTITPAIPGFGSGATAIATINTTSTAVSGITVTNSGGKYLGANNPATAYGASSVSQTVQGSGITVINIKLGTGMRKLPSN